MRFSFQNLRRFGLFAVTSASLGKLTFDFLKRIPPVEEKKLQIEYYKNTPEIPTSYSYVPVLTRLLSTQSELGNPVKTRENKPDGYSNIFFSNLVTAQTLAFRGRKQLTTEEKKKYKTYLDKEKGCLYRLINDIKTNVPNGIYSYIVSPKGGVYIFEGEDHGSIRGFQPVQCAGEVLIRNGKIYVINMAAKDYFCNWDQYFRTLGGLYAAGFIDEKTEYCFVMELRFYEKLGGKGGCHTIEDLIKSNGGDFKVPTLWTPDEDFPEKMRRSALSW